MTINLYLVSSEDIREKLLKFIAAYSDLNGHFSGTDVTKGSLLTIYTDLDPNHLALELRISVTKLHSINQSSRRKSPLRFIQTVQSSETEPSEETGGKFKSEQESTDGGERKIGYLNSC